MTIYESNSKYTSKRVLTSLSTRLLRLLCDGLAKRSTFRQNPYPKGSKSGPRPMPVIFLVGYTMQTVKGEQILKIIRLIGKGFGRPRPLC